MSMHIMGFGLSRILALSLVSFYSLTALAIGTAPVSLQAFKLQAINSPVIENLAKFVLSSTASLSLIQESYWIEGAVPAHLRSPSKTSVTLKPVTGGYEADVVASELAPGDYVFYLEVNPKTRLETVWTAILNFLHLPSTHLTVVVGAEFSVDASLEVPDPGAAGKTTLAGVDSDGDGIRDDIQRWLTETYARSPRTLAATKQLAKGAQIQLLSTSD